MTSSAQVLAKKIVYLIDSGRVRTADLVEECNVSKQAINGWRKTGRIAKGHLPIIARLAGVSVDWLIDGNEPDDMPVIKIRAARSSRPTWPFSTVSWQRYQALSAEDRADLDRRIGAIVTGFEAVTEPRKSPADSSAA